MTADRHFKRMKIQPEHNSLLLNIGEMEIWDGADLSLLREGLTHLIEVERSRSICIEMHFVKYIPSGFFGMLFDWHDKRGVDFFLTPPQPNVARMLWFRQFFELTGDGWFKLRPILSDEAPAYLEPGQPLERFSMESSLD